MERWTQRRSRRQAIKEARLYDTQRDPQENAESRPPESERVDVHSVWVAEVYTPSFVGTLLDGLHELGWDTRSSPALEHLDLAAWVMEGRGSAFGGGWVNITTITHPGDKSRLGARRGPLPNGVQYATGTLHSPTPGITVCVLQFVLDASSSEVVNKVLNSDFESKVVRTKRGLQFHDPKNLKHDALKGARRELRETCSSWFRRHLPGAFSAGLVSGRFPTIDVVTTELVKPFRVAKDDRSWYTWALGLDSDIDAWESIDLPELMLQVPHSWQDDVSALSLMGNKQELFADESRFQGYGGGDERLLWWLANSMDGDLVDWALQQLLVGYQQALGGLRDNVQVGRASPADAMRALQETRVALLTTTADAAQAAAEIREMKDRVHSSLGDYLDFLPASEWMRRRRGSFLAELREANRGLAQTVAATESQVRSMLSTDANVIGAIANIKMQKSLRLLTIVLIVLAVLTLAVASLQVWLLLGGASTSSP